MSETIEAGRLNSKSTAPYRLHHHAYVVADQERTRAFYEDLLGFPLVAFWIEDTVFEGKHIVLSHGFYGMQDGSALAFFNHADPDMQEFFKSPPTQVFNHVALLVDKDVQGHLLKKLSDAKYHNFVIEHGYCTSLYVKDPDGLLLEFTVDAEEVERINSVQTATAHETLNRWVAGDRTSNNDWRHD